MALAGIGTERRVPSRICSGHAVQDRLHLVRSLRGHAQQMIDFWVGLQPGLPGQQLVELLAAFCIKSGHGPVLTL